MPFGYTAEYLIERLKKLTPSNVDGLVNLFKKFGRTRSQEIRELTNIVIHAINEEKSDFMHWLAVKNEGGLFKYLIENKAHFNQADTHGLTPLHEATKNKAYSVINLIMDSDIQYSKEHDLPLETETRDKQGFTPIDYCLNQNDTAGFNILCDHTRRFWDNSLLNQQTQRMTLGSSQLESILPKTNNPNEIPEANWHEAVAVPQYTWISDPTAQIVNFHNGEISRRFCSGFLIDEKLFMTAGHCVGNVCSLQQKTDNLRVSFNYQYPYVDTDGNPAGSIKEFKLKINNIKEHGTCQGVDYAIYELEGNTAFENFGKVKLSLNEPTQGNNVVIAQHPNGLVKKVATGRVVATNAVTGTISYDADTMGGSSGSSLGSVSEKEVIGVHVLGSAHENTAVSIKKISEYSQTVKQIAQFGFLSSSSPQQPDNNAVTNQKHYKLTR